MQDLPSHHKALLAPVRAALYDFEEAHVRSALEAVFHPEAVVHMCFPFGDVVGPVEFYDTCFAPLHAAIPDLERRDWIVMAGQTPEGAHWVGCGGHYTGTFAAPFLDIPPTGHVVHMRFHEFYRFEGDRIVEVQAIWDIPEVMMQAGAWPMAPSLGLEYCVPGPATLDGLISGPWDPQQARASCDLIVDMLTHMTRHPAQGGPEVMEMERFWHPKMNWYGPAGIGTCRGISGFRNWHQIPFLNAMPDRGQSNDDLTFHFFGDANYAAVTGWPNMRQSLSADGWMGLVPSGQTIDLRSLDFWRIENGLIRENWVLVDVLDVYHQLGVDVFRRMREFNKARVPGAISYPLGEH